MNNVFHMRAAHFCWTPYLVDVVKPISSLSPPRMLPALCWPSDGDAALSVCRRRDREPAASRRWRKRVPRHARFSQGSRLADPPERRLLQPAAEGLPRSVSLVNFVSVNRGALSFARYHVACITYAMPNSISSALRYHAQILPPLGRKQQRCTGNFAFIPLDDGVLVLFS